MSRLSLVFAGTVLLCAASCASAPEQPAFPAQFEFAVIGDMPYGDEDTAMLRDEILPRIRSADYSFVIHVGDYKASGTACNAGHDDAQLALIEALAPKPVFYTPGDNEWTDCDRPPDSPMSELARLEQVRTLFYSKPAVAPKAMRAKRQESQRENIMWRHGGVRFVTLHVVGTNNGRDQVMRDPLDAAATAAGERDRANLAWLTKAFRMARKENAAAMVIAMQADISIIGKGGMCEDAASDFNHACDAFVDLRAAIRNEAARFQGPVLLIHGDTAPFTFSAAFLDVANLWRFNAAGDTGMAQSGEAYGFRDASVVSFSPVANPPFAARGLVTGEAPKSH